MTAADTAMKLRVLQHAITEALKVADAEVERVRAMTGAKSFTTDYGMITAAKRADSVTLPSAELLAWVEENYPDEIVTTKSVRPDFVDAVKKACTASDGTVIFTKTGEELDWARVYTGTEYLTSRLTAEAKRKAVEYVTANLDSVTGLLEVTA